MQTARQTVQLPWSAILLILLLLCVATVYTPILGPADQQVSALLQKQMITCSRIFEWGYDVLPTYHVLIVWQRSTTCIIYSLMKASWYFDQT